MPYTLLYEKKISQRFALTGIKLSDIFFFFIENCIWHIFNTDILQMYMYLTLYTYCVTPRLPARGTDLSVSVRVLEGLDQSQCLVHGSPDREIIHGDLTQRSFRINDKQTPEKTTETLSFIPSCQI